MWKILKTLRNEIRPNGHQSKTERHHYHQPSKRVPNHIRPAKQNIIALNGFSISTSNTETRVIRSIHSLCHVCGERLHSTSVFLTKD